MELQLKVTILSLIILRAVQLKEIKIFHINGMMQNGTLQALRTAIYLRRIQNAMPHNMEGTELPAYQQPVGLPALILKPLKLSMVNFI